MPDMTKFRFAFAKKKKCLIDDYDQIQRDFEPFYQLAQENSKHFQEMIDRGTALVGLARFSVDLLTRLQMLQDSKGMTTINIKNGKVNMPKYIGTAFYNDWPRTLKRVASRVVAFFSRINSNLVHFCPSGHGFYVERARRASRRLQLPRSRRAQGRDGSQRPQPVPHRTAPHLRFFQRPKRLQSVGHLQGLRHRWERRYCL
jgi:hypothetical protein